jgi:hypothetical protein
MEEQHTLTTQTNLNTKNLVATTAVVTSTVVLTIGAWRVVGELVYPPLHRLTTRLKKENETK